MKRWNIIVELPAQQDIAEAHLWLAEQAPDAANHWFESIYETMGSLEIFPDRCPHAPESKFLEADIRQILHGQRLHKYRILFTLSADAVHVLHVRHGARLALGESGSAEE
ncbi:MAG: type II toxin-antitoxin system RelE/ParE family toxin [Verrucomicrobiota bacterium]|nr:type II toxin-antitoxin system RelE/ParE family toxin [Verrucomicrobiota bacterium]